jgi:type IV pilus assembly protein PilO
MKLEDINDLDFNNIGSWPAAARGVLIGILIVVVLFLGYWFDVKDQVEGLEAAERKEVELKNTFETRARKAANLAAYEQQMDEMKESFGAMLRQLPNKTEVAELLVDISQTGLASGLEFELFKPQGENPRDFYAELPISIKVKGDYHEFGNFISGLAALPRIVTVHDIAITPLQDGQLSMDLTAKTYRYLDDEEAL